MRAMWWAAAVAMVCGASVDAHAQREGMKKAGDALERAAQARAAAKATTRYDETFRKYTKRNFGPGFDWHYFKAQAMAESNLDPNATSYVGARGLMQLMPSTYNMIQTKRPEFGPINDPESNIAAGIMHDRYLWKLWSKQIPEEQERFNYMFSAYNAGEGTLARALRIAREQQLDHTKWANIETIAPTVPRWRYRETLGYVRKIDAYYESLSSRAKGIAKVAPPAPSVAPATVAPATAAPGRPPAAPAGTPPPRS